jgi:hypothetical protein
MNYCLGLPFSCLRPIAEDERNHLNDSFLRARSRRIVTRIAAWTTPFLIIYGLALLTDLPGGDKGAAFVPSLLVFIGLPAGLLVVGEDAKRRLKIIQASVGATNVEIYESGPDIPENRRRQIARIPETGLLLREPEGLFSRVVVTQVSSATPRPVEQALRGLYPEPAGFDGGMSETHRFLSPVEVRDLNGVALRLAARPKLWTVLLAAYVIFGFWAESRHPVSAGMVVELGFLTLIGLISIAGFYVGFKQYILFKKDITTGFVVRTEIGHRAVELLPNSKYVWTVEGEPSLDRRIGKGYRKL